MYSLDFMTFPGWIALISGFLVIGQLLLTLFVGDLLDIDTDADGFGDFDMSTIASPKGLIHFLCGASWYLVLIQPFRDGRVWLWYDWFIAIGIGLVVAVLVIMLYYWMSKLACEKKKESGQDLINRVGHVYLNNGNGNYDVSINISGSTSIIQVTSKSGKKDLTTGSPVTIVEFQNGVYFIS